MATHLSNNSSNPHHNNIFTVLKNVNNKTIYIIQVFGLFYSLLCIFWLVFLICDLISKVRYRRRLVTVAKNDRQNDYQERLFMQNESIIRYYILLVFLFFELVYSLEVNVSGVSIELFNESEMQISIGQNCTLSSETFLGTPYDSRIGSIFLNINSNFSYFSFSMMIWLFGVSLFHLSFAARNELRVRVVRYYILLGLVINLVLMVTQLVPYTSIFGVIAQNLMDQISLFIVLFVARNKFFPAMNRRVNDAYHINAKMHLRQKGLLTQYKVVVSFFLVTFELAIIKDLFMYNLYVIFDSICINSCWFHVTYHFPMFTLSENVINILNQISYYSLILSHLTDIIIYFNFVLVNLTFLYVKTKIFFTSRFCHTTRYRYQGFSASAPLLPALNVK